MKRLVLFVVVSIVLILVCPVLADTPRGTFGGLMDEHRRVHIEGEYVPEDNFVVDLDSYGEDPDFTWTVQKIAGGFYSSHEGHNVEMALWPNYPKGEGEGEVIDIRELENYWLPTGHTVSYAAIANKRGGRYNAILSYCYSESPPDSPKITLKRKNGVAIVRIHNTLGVQLLARVRLAVSPTWFPENIFWVKIPPGEEREYHSNFYLDISFWEYHERNPVLMPMGEIEVWSWDPPYAESARVDSNGTCVIRGENLSRIDCVVIWYRTGYCGEMPIETWLDIHEGLEVNEKQVSFAWTGKVPNSELHQLTLYEPGRMTNSLPVEGSRHWQMIPLVIR